MKPFEVVWTKSAEFDLELIIEYIKTDSLNTAKKDCTRITTNWYFKI